LGPTYDAAPSRLTGLSGPQAEILALQRTAGNWAVNQLLQSGSSNIGAIQPKLIVGQPGDRYEQEADQVANQVMRMSEPRIQRRVDLEEEEDEVFQTKPLAEQITPSVQRQSIEEEEEDEKELLLTSQGAGQTPEVTPELESRIEVLRGGGQALDSGVRTQMEPAFVADFSGVRVHADAKADTLSRALNARAFTVGQDIFFRQGAYSPGSSSGRELLAHELTHVVQQIGKARQKLSIGQPGDKHEQEAENAALAVMKRERQVASKEVKDESKHGLMRIVRQRNQYAPQIQRWLAPTDWLDYIGLAIDLGERIYIELAYEEGQEKDFQRFVNTLFFAIDGVLAILPGAGGGGLVARASHGAAVAAWDVLPASAKLTVTEQVAKAMGWTLVKATQMINRYFSASKSSEKRVREERAKGPSGEASTKKYLEKRWDKGTFPTVEKSIEYHVKKHGKGLSAVEYTQRGEKAFKDVGAAPSSTADRLGRPAVKVVSDKFGKGLFTPKGKIIWFHPKL
jgi:hypothetical protein